MCPSWNEVRGKLNKLFSKQLKFKQVTVGKEAKTASTDVSEICG
jgi:hypothetical protein